MGVLKKIYNFASSWTGTVLIVLFVIFFVAQAFVIPSGSMKHSLLPGDFLFVKKFSYGIPTPHIPWIEKAVLPDFKGNGHLIDGERPKRGDIVVFREPQNPKIHFVKRNFAVGGDLQDADSLAAYADSLVPAVYDDFIGTAKSVMTKRHRDALRKLLNYRFKRHPRYNLPDERLVLIEKEIQRRARLLLDE